MRETFTKGMARNIYYGGAVFFTLLLLVLTVDTVRTIPKTDNSINITEDVAAGKKGLQPFCITIDESAGDYLPYLFGKNAYIHVKRIKDLPLKLPQLYLRLT